MRALGLDLSTKPGLAAVDFPDDSGPGRILELETGELERRPDYPYGYVAMAEAVADLVDDWVQRHRPDLIVIEETNMGRARFTQKQLEFIHFAVLKRLEGQNILYLDTSAWRAALGLRLSKEERAQNRAVKQAKAVGEKPQVRGKITVKHLAVSWANATFGLALKQKDNDKADALALVVAAMILKKSA